jgi:hypothetical protein
MRTLPAFWSFDDLGGGNVDDRRLEILGNRRESVRKRDRLWDGEQFGATWRLCAGGQRAVGDYRTNKNADAERTRNQEESKNLAAPHPIP